MNLGNATSQDVLDLIRYVRKTVYEKTGILLEPEVRIIGGVMNLLIITGMSGAGRACASNTSRISAIFAWTIFRPR